MSIMFFGPIAAAIVSGLAVYSLLWIKQDSGRMTAARLVRDTARKSAP